MSEEEGPVILEFMILVIPKSAIINEDLQIEGVALQNGDLEKFARSLGPMPADCVYRARLRVA
jgi:hypothetical protein